MADYAAAIIEWGSTPDQITLLELLKQQLGITGTAEDAALSMHLQMAGEAAERYIDNVIARQEVTQKLSHSRTPVSLRYSPYQGSMTITVDGDDVSADYEAFSDEGLTWSVKGRSATSRSCTFKQMNITYEAGYSPLPADLGFAIVQTAQAYGIGDGQGGTVRRESVVGVGSFEFATSEDAAASRVGMLPSAAVGVLERYRRYWA